jgi:excisionase family DNA binding protein
MLSDRVLTIAEVACELRCSKSHVSKVIRGEVVGVSALPAIEMGRRKLVRQSALEQWKQANERSSAENATLSGSLEVDAVRRA